MKLVAEKTARPRRVVRWRRMDVNVMDAEVAFGRKRRAGRVMRERVPEMPCRLKLVLMFYEGIDTW